MFKSLFFTVLLLWISFSFRREHTKKLTFCFLFDVKRKKNAKTEQPLWREFTLKELHAATNSFNYDNKLGEGRFGSVYWGQLPDGSQVMSLFLSWKDCINWSL